jgi:hypothetical protein
MTQLMTTAEAATYLSLSPRTLETWRVKQIGPPVTRLSSRAVRYSADALEAWVEESSKAGQP